MIGTKFYKSSYKQSDYVSAAIWCNANNAYIKDQGEYYEVLSITITLKDAQNTALKFVNNLAEKAYTVGFSSAASGTVLIYDSDNYTQIEIQTTAALAANTSTNFTTQFPNGFPIRARATVDATKQIIYLTASQLITLYTDWITRYKAIKTQVWNLQSEINAATTVEDVTKISINIS
jgi:hypothetical protein